MTAAQPPLPSEPFTLSRPEPPDADWEGLRAQALAHLDGAWSDHNLSDPGITILEAGLWTLADLHYRTAGRPLGAWHAEVAGRPEGGNRVGVPLDGLSQDQRERVARVLVTHGAQLREFVDAASSEGAAVVSLLDRDFDGLTLDETEARAAAHLVRRPGLERHARDRSALVAAAVDERGWAGAAAALADRPELGGLWPSEREALVGQDRRRRLVRLLTEDVAAVEATVDALGWPDALVELQDTFDLDPVQAEQAAATHSCPPGAFPESFEDLDGTTRVWPPHPLQARTTEPVTAGDYRRLALQLPAVKRAWVAKGLLAGVDWDGRERTDPLPYRQGGLTLVVEPAGDESSDPLPAPGEALTSAQANYLREVLRGALAGPGETAEVDVPYARFRDNLNAAAPRRLIGDELAAALLKAQPVVVKGVLHIDPSATREAVLADADTRLEDFLSSDRIEPGASPPPTAAATPCPGGIGGPWPVPVEPVLGWTPGSPVRVSEVVQLLAAVEGVVGVESVAVRHGETGDWAGQELALAPDAVPDYAGHCLRVRATKPRVCDA